MGEIKMGNERVQFLLVILEILFTHFYCITFPACDQMEKMTREGAYSDI
jgi:hypothetical protein